MIVIIIIIIIIMIILITLKEGNTLLNMYMQVTREVKHYVIIRITLSYSTTTTTSGLLIRDTSLI